MKTYFSSVLFIAGIFVSILLFLLIKIIAYKLCQRKIFHKSRQENICGENRENIFQDIYTIPSENKIVVNNFQVVINTCKCKNCKDCHDTQESEEEKLNVMNRVDETIDKDLIFSVVKSKYPNLWKFCQKCMNKYFWIKFTKIVVFSSLENSD